MTRGKRTCRILKEIRRQIAAANDIEYITSECPYQGECPGTCPKCESEVLYREMQLASRRMAGHAIALAGISVSMFMSACAQPASAGAESVPSAESITSEVNAPNPPLRNSNQPDATENQVIEHTHGEVLIIGEEELDYSSDDRVFEVVEEKPRFPGGEKALLEFLHKAIRYPESAKRDSVQGRVVVQFVVTKDGSIGDVRVVRPKHPDLDKEAERVVKLLPKFEPGKMKGYIVNAWFTVPITFKLDSDSVADGSR